jgi:restriction system protein
MPVPDYETLMLPVLREAAKGETTVPRLREPIAAEFRLTPAEVEERIPSGYMTTLSSRLHWAKTYLRNAALVEYPRRGAVIATERGRAVVKRPPDRIDVAFLRKFPEFVAFESRSRGGRGTAAAGENASASPKTPEEQIEAAHALMTASLRDELLRSVYAAGAAPLEQTTRDLMHRMGYGAAVPGSGRVVGGTGDGGVDVIMSEDALGLGVVCVQCKCYAPDRAIDAPDVRLFVGALDRWRAKKGVFVTTSRFTEPARREVEHLGDKRIVLIDGDELAARMIEYGLGVQTARTFELKRIDRDFFESDEGVA